MLTSGLQVRNDGDHPDDPDFTIIRCARMKVSLMMAFVLSVVLNEKIAWYQSKVNKVLDVFTHYSAMNS